MYQDTMKKKAFTFTLLSALLLFSCNQNSENHQERIYIPMNDVKDVLTNLKPLKSTFELAANEESVIKGKKGTVIYIPANSFVFKDGTKPKGTIKIEVKECYSNASIIGQGLHTNSQNSVLASGGMVYLAAKSDGKDLEIMDGKALQIGFPKPNSNNEMDLFYSVKAPNGASTWIPDYKMFELEQVSLSEESNSDTAPPLEYPIEMTDNEYRYQLSFAMCGGNMCDARIKGYNGDIFQYLEDQATVSESVGKLFYKNNWRVHLDFKINEEGKLYDFRLEEHDDGELTNYTPEAIRLTEEYFKAISPIELESIGGYNKNYYYSLGIMGSRDIDWGKFKLKFRNQFAKSKKDATVKINQFELDNYVFAVTRLGWINCDRFLDIPDDQKTDFIVSSTEQSEQKIRLIFENNGSERTIMNGETKDGKTIFKEVPIGQQITIIGIGLANGTPMFAKEKTKISNTPFVLSNYKALEINELENELNRIN